MDRKDLKILKQNLDHIYELLGINKKHSISTENLVRQNARSSLVAGREILTGEIIEPTDLT